MALRLYRLTFQLPSKNVKVHTSYEVKHVKQHCNGYKTDGPTVSTDALQAKLGEMCEVLDQMNGSHKLAKTAKSLGRKYLLSALFFFSSPSGQNNNNHMQSYIYIYMIINI